MISSVKQGDVLYSVSVFEPEENSGEPYTHELCTHVVRTVRRRPRPPYTGSRLPPRGAVAYVVERNKFTFRKGRWQKSIWRGYKDRFPPDDVPPRYARTRSGAFVAALAIQRAEARLYQGEDWWDAEAHRALIARLKGALTKLRRTT